MEKQINGVITNKNFKSNKDEIISNEEKQMDEIAEILAKNFTLYDGATTFCAGDFEWCAYQLMENGYRKVVMCKDCKYFFNEHIKACTYWNGHATTETNYCSCAKMRGE